MMAGDIATDMAHAEVMAHAEGIVEDAAGIGIVGITIGADIGITPGMGMKLLGCQKDGAMFDAWLLVLSKVVKVGAGADDGATASTDVGTGTGVGTADAMVGIAMVGIGCGTGVEDVNLGLNTLVGPLDMRSKTTLDSTLPKSSVSHESSIPEELSSSDDGLREGEVS